MKKKSILKKPRTDPNAAPLSFPGDTVDPPTLGGQIPWGTRPGVNNGDKGVDDVGEGGRQIRVWDPNAQYQTGAAPASQLQNQAIPGNTIDLTQLQNMGRLAQRLESMFDGLSNR